ncbi:hypothetical protein PISL3812_08487 [Talaromyces islandicus]|uniref:Suppressor protein SRP40 n=1 Tax=Talaromyces islandicus TaxID=28573 RepID=A0A0U1M787_TALIS|nr:hypothetical protein PISL3812_08487 [Talaromyces islandicus]
MTTALTRLHISPLDPALLDSILGPTNRPLATNISFHTIPTFPENSFGYVSLPSMEADKLKKKLNGSILKGKRLKVEAARPDPKEIRKSPESPDTQKKEKKEKKKSSKRKAEEEDGVLQGLELPADRQVKRGWTEPANSRKYKKQKKSDKEAKPAKLQTKSKYTEKAECLFKTKTPPNKTVTGKKDKKSKSDKPPNEVVVHEFAQTITHPSFLKSTTQEEPVTAGFEEGKGWVDKDGKVKEAASDKARKSTFNPGKKDGAKERVSKKSKLDRHSTVKEIPSTPISSPGESEENPDWTSSSGSSDNDSSSSESDSSDGSVSDDTSDNESLESNKEKRIVKAKPESFNKPAHGEKTKPLNEDELESGASSKKEDSSEDSNSTSDKASSNEGSSEDSSSSSEDDTEDNKTKKVHPLEALFKRKEQQPEEINAGFSFFGGNNDDIEDEDEDEIRQPTSTEPLTPFTRRDRLVRGVRSAAPTPDTAMRSQPKLLTDEDEDMEDLEDSYLPITESSPSKTRDESVAPQPQETDFAKWFWENRGDNNRAWKKRRRDAAKEKRQRDNRRKGMKGRG